MKQVLVCGSWRYVRADVERDVRAAVRDILGQGNAVITGGALGVDEWATDEALQIDSSAMHLTVVLPTAFDVYAAHLRRRVTEGVVDADRVEGLIALLTRVRDARAGAVVDGPADVCTVETYYARNSVMNDMADGVYAFQVNNSPGTQDQIDKARTSGLEVKVWGYGG